jgi:hypothetical protein
MRRRPVLFLLAVALAVPTVVACSACRASDSEPIPADRRVIPLTPTDNDATKEFEVRIKSYLEVHRRLEATLPKLSKESTPKQVDDSQRALGALIQAERKGAKRGEFFTPGMVDLVQRTMKQVLSGPDAKTIRASIMDENPGVPNLSVNDRYPDSIPLSTMPPQVLEPLPKLDEDLEYRFIGKRLVLLDTHAHLVLDFTDDVLS